MEIDAETIIEMEAVLDLIGVIIMVGIDHAHTEGECSVVFGKLACRKRMEATGYEIEGVYQRGTHSDFGGQWSPT